MPPSLSRRTLLKGMAASLTVVAFDASLGSWLTAADVAAGHTGSGDFPTFDGALVTSEAALTEAADDFGHIVYRRPFAVLQPGSVEDVARLIQYARQHGIQVAAQGQRHSTQGQAQVEAGVAIDMRFLAAIQEINSDNALVQAGVKWSTLLQQTVPLGLSPPTVTDFIELSVGGTLSVGGIGGQAFRHGTQADNVLELQVVTGKGQLLTCSATQHRELFNACRAGLGQYGVIVGARVRLVPVPSMVRVYTATYADLRTFMADQERLINEGRFDYVEGSVQAGSAGAWLYQIELAKYFNPSQPPNDLLLTGGLRYLPGTLSSEDKSYYDFANRLELLITLLKESGAWYLPHPWLNLFIPASKAPALIEQILRGTNAANTGEGPLLLYPMQRAVMQAPLFRVPDESRFFVLSLLRQATPPTTAWVEQLIALNRSIYEQVRAVGGTRYPIDSVPMLAGDWAAHYGPLWPQAQFSKQHYDPANILAPGQGIF